MDKQESCHNAHFLESLSLLGASKWNGLTGTENPFTRYEFLYELERTGCTSEPTGWQPCHLALYEGDPASTEETSPLAVMPLYRKTNSWVNMSLTGHGQMRIRVMVMTIIRSWLRQRLSLLAMARGSLLLMAKTGTLLSA